MLLMTLGDLEFRQLSLRDHATEVRSFIEHNRRFFVEVENVSPTEQLVEEIFTSVPDGIDPQQKLVVGVYREQRLVAFHEWIKDRHEAGEWLLSLLIVDRDLRREGLGRRIMNEFEAYLRERDVHCVLLGVVEGNTPAGSFWSSMNYVRTDIVTEQQIGNRPGRVRAYFKEL